MKKVISIILALMMLSQHAYASLLGDVITSWSHEIANGTEIYNNTFMSTQSGVGQQVEYYAEYVPNDKVVPAVVNGQSLWGLKKIDKIEKYMKENDMVPLIGINASYFSWETGIPMGHVITDGKIVSKDTLTYDSIGFAKDGTAFILPLAIETTLTSGETVIDIAHINKYNQTITDVVNLYTTDFDDNNHTSSPSLNLVLGNIEGDLTIGGEVKAVVEEKFNYGASIKIPEKKIVLTLNESGIPELYEGLNSLNVGDEVTISSKALENDELWETANSALGSVGETLIKNGEIQKGFPSGAAPRTAVGITENGNVIFYVIDGRQSPYSYGVRVETLANRMLELGCVDAINLDGGGSTIISGIYPGADETAVLNSPSEGKPRTCSNYIFLKNMQKATSELDKLYIYPFQRHYLSGFSEKLSPKGVDSAYFKAELPEDLEFSVSGTESTIDKTGTLTAKGTGTFSVNVTGGGVSGHAEYTTYETPTDIIVYNSATNKEIKELTLKKGDSIKIDLVAKYNHIKLLSSNDCFNMEISNELGEIQGNELVITKDGGEGKLLVSAGEFVKEIPIKVEYEYIFADVSNHWAKEMIKSASIKGIISGYETEEGILFKPDNNMTREEFAAVVSRLLKIDTEKYKDYELEFKDAVSISDWAVPYVSAMFDEQLITGKLAGEDILFAPKDTLTRAEAMTILSRVLSKGDKKTFTEDENVENSDEDVYLDADEETQANYEKVVFADYDEIPEWAKEHVELLVSEGIVNGYSDNTIRPKALVTRAEAVTIISGIPEIN